MVDLKGDIGGVPIYVIGGGLGLALVGYSYVRAHNKAATNAVPITAGDATGYPILGPGQVSTAPATGTANVVVPYQSNTMWSTKVFTALVGQGTSPILLQQALEHYLNGTQLTIPEGAIIAKALLLFGLPPEGVTNTPSVVDPIPPRPPPPTQPPVAPPPPPPPPPPPVQPAPVPTRTYTVVSGDTLSAIALRFYGTTGPFYWLKIANANGIANPNLIYPGNVLKIPA